MPSGIEIHSAESKASPHRAGLPSPQQLAIWSAIAFGAALRILLYCKNSSLWLDEALLALNIVRRPLSGMFRPLDYNQGAPVGFLLLEKLVTHAFGNGELSLRLIPLIAGLDSLFLFWKVARLYLRLNAVPVAMALFALCAPLILFSSEVKPYSTDVAISLVLLWAGKNMTESTLEWRQVLGFGLLGAVAIWFSFPASFVLAGIAAVLVIKAVRQPRRTRPPRLEIVTLVWAFSFAACYFLLLRGLAHNHELLDFWSAYFVPYPISWNSFTWFAARFADMFRDPAGLMEALGLGFFLAGCWSLFRKNEEHEAFGLLTAPILMTMIAAALRRYPFQGRLLAFLVPSLLLLVAQGAMWIAEKVRKIRAIAFLFVVSLLVQPVLGAADLLRHEPPEDIKPAIQYIREHQRPGDSWYVYHFARYQYWYYVPSPAAEEVIIGRDCGSDPACYASDLDQLRGKSRLWILFSHIWTGSGVNEEEFFLNRLDSMGVRLDQFRSHQARAYLYDLSGGKE